MPAVSIVATLAATILGFALGALWYGPFFGRRWMAAVGITPDRMQRRGNAARAYAATFALGFIASYAFGLYLGPSPGRAFAITAGAVVGLCWVTTSLATNYLFEGRPLALVAINGGYHAVRFTLMGLAFALLG
jgi:hypothetical protein